MALTFQVTVDCAAPHVLANWWARALDWPVEKSDEDFIRTMIEHGHASESDTEIFDGALVWSEGAAISNPELAGSPRLYFQRVPEPKTTKNRLHLDIRTGSEGLEAVRTRLEAAGATFLWEGKQGQHTWATMADPEGNEFCVSQ